MGDPAPVLMVPGSSSWSVLPSEGWVTHEPRDGVGAGHGHGGDRSSQDGDVDWSMAVLPSEAAALVAAYQRAQAAEVIVRRMLARMGLADAVEPGRDARQLRPACGVSGVERRPTRHFCSDHRARQHDLVTATRCGMRSASMEESVSVCMNYEPSQ